MCDPHIQCRVIALKKMFNEIKLLLQTCIINNFINNMSIDINKHTPSCISVLTSVVFLVVVFLSYVRLFSPNLFFYANKQLFTRTTNNIQTPVEIQIWGRDWRPFREILQLLFPFVLISNLI